LKDHWPAREIVLSPAVVAIFESVAFLQPAHIVIAAAAAIVTIDRIIWSFNFGYLHERNGVRCTPYGIFTFMRATEFISPISGV